jgi:hypothetical protein
MKIFDAILLRLIVISILGFIGFLLYRVVSTSVSPSSDSEAMIQMAQWTIATILTVGAALIGINWYQAERRYERDRADLQTEFEKRFESISDWVASVEIRNYIGFPTASNYLGLVNKLFEQTTDTTRKRIIADLVDGDGSHFITVPRFNSDVIDPYDDRENLRKFLVNAQQDIPSFHSKLLSQIDQHTANYPSP